MNKGYKKNSWKNLRATAYIYQLSSNHQVQLPQWPYHTLHKPKLVKECVFERAPY